MPDEQVRRGAGRASAVGPGNSEFNHGGVGTAHRPAPTDCGVNFMPKTGELIVEIEDLLGLLQEIEAHDDLFFVLHIHRCVVQNHIVK